MSGTLFFIILASTATNNLVVTCVAAVARVLCAASALYDAHAVYAARALYAACSADRA